MAGRRCHWLHVPVCAQARYPLQPPQQRLQRAVWRGSNTDSRVSLMDESNVLDVVRTRLHMFGRWYPDAIDAHYTGFPQQAFAGNCIGELMPPGVCASLTVEVDGGGPFMIGACCKH